MKEKLQLRKEIKKKKPNFVRQEIGKQKKITAKWRRPKGIQSKVRLHKRGKRRCVSPGYGSPKEVKDLSPDGFIQVIISNISKMQELDAKTQGIIISGTVGNKKKLAIIEESKKLGLKIINIKDAEKKVLQINEKLKIRKEKRSKRKTSQDTKKKSSIKSEKKKEEKQSSDEENKKEEKKKQEKILTKKE